MIQPRAYKAVCKTCGKSKIVAPKSDVLGADSFAICPKCKTLMEGREELNVLDSVLDTALNTLKGAFSGKPKMPKI